MNVNSILSNTQTTETVRILVVEDEYILAMNLQETLELLGYTVSDIADSAETAIEKAAELLPNLVLMDIQLQGEMDGIHAAELIWNRFQIPIVYITGHSDKSTVDRAKLTFAFGYILKPIKEQQLYVAIQTALNCYQREQLSQLQRLNQFKEDFLATTSHEMRMPLISPRHNRIYQYSRLDKIHSYTTIKPVKFISLSEYYLYLYTVLKIQK
ncbi:response regulator [Nostoc sp. C110]|uniref:response regulator n=1 Tax=Nostoc sp. C110 TaxID=3349876 RepID=UPI00370DC58F